MDTRINGAHLKNQIKQAGYTLEEFRQELGVGKTAFYYYRTGVRPMPHQIRSRIEQLLQCSFQVFLRSEQENIILLPVEQQRRAGRVR